MLNSKQLETISNQISIDVDNYCDKKWKNENRKHLGFSMIGDECQRKLWYGFRWCKQPEFQPRIKRLFNRGHLEEDRFIDYLTGIGCKVKAFDDSYLLLINKNTHEYSIDKVCDDNVYFNVSSNITHIQNANLAGLSYPVQYKVDYCNGHAGGSLDGIGRLPDSYGLDEDILFEFKTHNDKSFKDLQKQGLKLSKPMHYAQCCAYGYLKGLNYVCYVAVNKNDDDLYIEFTNINLKTGETLVKKAENIILYQTAPHKLHENPTFWVCKMCSYFSVCHGKQEFDKNCRSCKHSEPAKDKLWVCNKHQQVLLDSMIPCHYQCWESLENV